MEKRFIAYADAAAEIAATGAAPGDPLSMPIDEARRRQAAYFAAFNRAVPAVHAEHDAAIDGPYGPIPVRLALPRAGGDLPCIVFVRGAGFWAGGLDSHRTTVNTLALISGCAVCAVDYRRTPEFAFPVQRDEVLTTLDWLRANGVAYGLRTAPPVLFGESAGATISLAAALALRDARAALPAGLVLFYPNAGGPASAPRAYSRWVWQQYLGGGDAAAVPGPVPMLAPMNGLPPVWLGCGEADPLMRDTVDLAARLAAAHVPHTVVRFPEMPHAFVMYSATLQPAYDALAQAAAAAQHFLDPIHA